VLLPGADVDAVEIHLRRADARRRLLAWGIDLLPLVLLGAWLWRTVLAGVPASSGGLDGLLDLLARERALVLPLAAVLLVAALVYATLSHALMGATLGKWVAGIRVVGPDGKRPSWKRSAARSAAAMISVGALGLGCLLALFTRSGRALHDLAAGTYVVEAP
jgi:uncharacterized RDD family membrane protein YckC